MGGRRKFIYRGGRQIELSSIELNDEKLSTIIIDNIKIINVQFHASTSDVNMRWLLHKKDFNVIFINEHLTSSRCSLCHNSVQKFLKRLSSRSWRKNLSPSLVHDIINCQSNECRLALREKNRVWNRDLLMTLNFRRILKGYKNEKLLLKKSIMLHFII